MNQRIWTANDKEEWIAGIIELAAKDGWEMSRDTAESLWNTYGPSPEGEDLSPREALDEDYSYA